MKGAVLEAELAEEYDLGEYRIRPPKGFELKSDDNMPRGIGRLIVWRSADDVRGFSVAFITLTGESDPTTPALIRKIGLAQKLNRYKESVPERCTLANLPFEHCTAEFTHRNDDTKMSSLIYSHAGDRKGILIWYVYPAGPDEKQLKVVTKAIQSFRKS